MGTWMGRLALASIGAVAAWGAQAATITGNPFAVSVSDRTEVVGAAVGIAGQDGLDASLMASVFEATPDSFRVADVSLSIDWVDGNSFDFAIVDAGNIAIQDLSFTLSNLVFSLGFFSEITAFTFNRQASRLNEFDDVGSFVTPGLAFTDGSVTVSGLGLGQQLAADGPVLRFDVLAQVPLPASLPLLGAAALGLAALRRRRA